MVRCPGIQPRGVTVDLGRLLNLEENEKGPWLPQDTVRAVLPVSRPSLGLVVDRLINCREVIIKPLGSYLGRLPGVGGVTILGDGKLALVLDLQDLAQLALEQQAVGEEEPSQKIPED